MSILSVACGPRLRSLMNQIFSEITKAESAEVIKVDTGTDEDVNLSITGTADNLEVTRIVSKRWLTERMIACIKEQLLEEAA